MASLHIKGFGPIVDSTKIELTPLMVLIGRQSAGKSTFMKVLCFCRWIEKKIMVSTDDMVNQYTHYNRFVKELKQFHRLNDEYFTDDTHLMYDGDNITIEYHGVNGNAKILRKKSFAEKRFNTKLCYIPAERNLISAIQNVDKTYKATERDVLFNFIYEWDEAKIPYTSEHPFKLAATGGFSYVNKSGADVLVREDGTETPAFYASSGMQSVMPMDVMANYITERVGNNASLSMHERNEINKTDNGHSYRRLEYQSAQLFIEEPEQNLYPESQKLVVLSLVRSLKKALENGSEQSMAMVTTHSPYVMSVTNVLLAAAIVGEKGLRQTVVDKDCIIPSKAISGYYIDEKGVFQNIMDRKIPMLSGNDLDGVSDWVDESISKLNQILFA
ncbi:MAG: AAA family ATPase [Bacteroidaceae bacterium]|nr:AAA family ATPase [Bacteroidaceae bacterium]